MEEKQPKQLNLEQQRQLLTAQRRLEAGVYSFRQYHDYLTLKVYNT